MTRALPTRPLQLLLHTYDPTNPDPPAAMQQGADALLAALGATVVAGLNDGQYAALIDRALVMGASGFAATRLASLVAGGNQTLPVYEFQKYGDRGLAELDVWLAGALVE